MSHDEEHKRGRDSLNYTRIGKVSTYLIFKVLVSKLYLLETKQKPEELKGIKTHAQTILNSVYLSHWVLWVYCMLLGITYIGNTGL
jgi:hypothetical protein